MSEKSDLQRTLRLFALAYAPIALLFTLVILLVFWFGRPSQIEIVEDPDPFTPSSQATE